MQTTKKPHSRLGIASFVLAMLSPFCLFACFFMVGIQMHHVSTPTMRALQDSLSGLGGTTVLFAFLLGPLLAVLALLLGILGLFQNKRRKFFALLGILTLNLIWILPALFIYVLSYI